MQLTKENFTEIDFKAGCFILIDKPLNWTSFDIVNKVRYAVKRKLNVKKIKVGHAGTLDPLATGLVILCTGKFTKKLNDFQDLGKQYLSEICLGTVTDSFDLETEPKDPKPYDHINLEAIENSVKKFMGEIAQAPPIFSAIKVDGERLYKKARRGEKVEVKLRKVKIFNIDIKNVDLPKLTIDVHCGKGTYIRSLANDIGADLECGGHLSGLIRTAIGEYKNSDAWNLDELIKCFDSNTNSDLKRSLTMDN